jgi:hypothetical protein
MGDREAAEPGMPQHWAAHPMRCLLAGAVVVLVPLFCASAASATTPLAGATLTSSGVACAGGGISSGSGGGAHAVVVPGGPGSSPSNPLIVQKGATIAWHGRTSVPITNHHWHLDLFGVTVASGGSPNALQERSVSGTVHAATFTKNLVGLYYVSGVITGDQGSCLGSFWLKVPGSPLGTPIGLAVVAIGAIALVGLGWFSRPRA